MTDMHLVPEANITQGAHVSRSGAVEPFNGAEGTKLLAKRSERSVHQETLSYMETNS